MKIKAFTTVAIRILGLMALLRGAMSSVSVVMLYSGALTGGSSPSGRAMATQSAAVAISAVVPIIVAIVCLAYSKPLAELLTRGVDENS